MPSIIVKNLGLDFPIYDNIRSLRRAIFKNWIGGNVSKNTHNNQKPMVTALESVNLELKEGDRLGLVGHNGAGKSTLLRVLAGVYTPSRGSVNIDGTISSLLSTGLGMCDDDSGYENIHNTFMLMGMTKKKTSLLTEQVAEFTELGGFLDFPMKTYSSGMKMRLAFAIATSIEPEVFLVDEVIGAGDAYFVQKSQNRIMELVKKSNILVIASHSDSIIQQMCNKAALFQHGQLVLLGEVNEVLDRYHERSTNRELETVN